MAIEAVVMSAVTGALKPVIGKLGALLGDEYKRFKGVRKDIKYLKHELTAMDAFLMKMSEEEDPDVQDKEWMNEVRELSYDMEDCIDDFMQSIGGDNDTKPDGFLEKIKHSLGKMKARRRIGNEIEDLKKQIVEVSERNARYMTRQSFANTKNATVDPRALVIFENASKLVGIDQPKAEIINLMTEENGCVSTQEKLKVVSIVGSGGMGKTTLAYQVYQELKWKFQCRAFFSVSRNPDIMNILRTILSEVTGKEYATTEAGSIQQLIMKIAEFLGGKRYFIVVDDVWDVNTWDVIKRAFPMTNSSGRIITTTRMSNVAHSCSSSFSGHIYIIRPLDIVHSRKLFHIRLFNSKENCPSHLEQVSDKILEKCDGLPLAIIAISGLLANMERREDLWNQVKDSIGCALERNSSVEGMMKILSLSYLDLPCHLKSCFLYISMFLEDSIIGRRCLIMGWIGEGFIHKEDRYTIYEIGERCFNELLNRSLIQAVETTECGKVKTFRVHDTILDFIISKSIEENFVTLFGVPILTTGTQNKVVRRLSIQGVKQGISTISKAGLVLSRVRSLKIIGESVKIPSFLHFRYMRVLNFENCHKLERHHLEDIVTLFQLRYLNLKNTTIRVLPEQIERLGCLEMLDLRGSNVVKLPASIVNLKKLSHLLHNAVGFPDGIVKMQALETLKRAWISKQPLDFLWGLGQLKNLRNLVLDYYDVQYDTRDMDMVEECKKAIVSSLCKLGTQNLRSLVIVNGSSLLEEPLCLPTLEKLMIWCSHVPRVPKWVSSLRNLQKLRFEVWGVKQDDLCILGALPALLFLYLDGPCESDTKLKISSETGFRFLKIFCYDANLQPADLMFLAGSMPKLEYLGIYHFSIVKPDFHGIGIENLPCLSTVNCTIHCYDRIFYAIKADMERAASTHPNHPTLLFKQF